MSHIETQLQSPAPLEPSRKRKQKLSFFLGCALSIMLISGYVLTNWFPQNSTDSVSQKETTQRLNDFSSLKSLDAVQVAQKDEQEILGKLGLSPKNHELLQQALQESQRQGVSSVSTPSATVQSDSDRLHLIALTFWDTHSEDGDIVHVSSEGYERDITLKKVPITVNLPCKNMSRVKITGVRDGGGGITLGVKGEQTVNMPIMRPGQSLELTISLPQ